MLICLLLLFLSPDIINNLLQVDFLHCRKRLLFDLLVSLCQHLLDITTNDALGVSLRIDVEQVMVGIDCHENIVEVNLSRSLRQFSARHALAAIDQPRLAQVAGEAADNAGVGFNTAGDCSAGKVAVMINVKIS